MTTDVQLESTIVIKDGVELKAMTQLCTPDIAGIFWPIDTSLEKRPWPFVELDYLFDGLITQNIGAEVSASNFLSKIRLISNRQFNDFLYLIVFDANHGKLSAEEINHLLEILFKNERGKNTLLYIDSNLGSEKKHTQDDLKKIIQKKFPKKKIKVLRKSNDISHP